MRRSYLKRKTKLRVVGVSTTAELKEDIQGLVRLIVTIRDKGCILRKLRHCGGEAIVENGEILSNNVIQADHLITRGNSATFADTRLIVCLCKNCHGWKHWHEAEYDALVRSILPPERILLWNRCIEALHAHRTVKMDWKLEILALKKELSALK